MGISKAGVKMLLKEASQRPLTGSVLTLGKQGIWITFKTLQKISNDFGVAIKDPGEITLSYNPEGRAKNCISDECLFKSLGFSECKSLDISDCEGADYIFDLNQPKLPPDLRERFDVIIDGGTFEHLFHIPNAFKCIWGMLRPGGRIVHIAPSSNHMDHGFYMFSPILFWEFYTQNQFKILNSQFFRYHIQHETKPWDIYDYEPGCLGRVSLGGLDNKLYGVCLIASKTPSSTCDVIPQQKEYDKTKCQNIKFLELRNKWIRRPLIYKWLRPIASKILLRRFGLKLVDRY